MNDDNRQNDVADLSLRIRGARKPKEPGAARAFFKGTLKLATALLIVALVLGGIIAGISGLVYVREQARNRPLAEAKILGAVVVPSLENTSLTLTIKWQDYRMHYQFNVAGYPSELRKSAESARQTWSENRGFTLIFLDSNGFKLAETSIPLSSMTRVVNESGGFQGLSSKGSTYLSADIYRQIATWEVQWRL